MYRFSVIGFLVINLVCFQLSAQSQGKIIVKGRVLDSLASTPLGFATVRIFDNADKKLINGNISNEAGDFSLELTPGDYYAVVDFMGYNSYNVRPFKLSKEQDTHDLGQIKLSPSISTLDEIVVQA
jgi:ferric enterobactin receptor